jgi:hypothetical protein
MEGDVMENFKRMMTNNFKKTKITNFIKTKSIPLNFEPQTKTHIKMKLLSFIHHFLLYVKIYPLYVHLLNLLNLLIKSKKRYG